MAVATYGSENYYSVISNDAVPSKDPCKWL